MPNGDKTSLKAPLRANFALLHEEGACLPLRSRHGQCRACAQACPVGALEVSLSGVGLGDACMGCGRCVAACPTEALMLPELDQLLDDAGVMQKGALRIECRKVPPSAHRGTTLQVPCLGALRTGQLMAQAARGVDVQLIDHGWCESCEAGCREGAAAVPQAHAAEDALAAARLWLEAAGCEQLPQRVVEPLPLELRPPAIPPAPTLAEPVSRRSFFRAALDKPAGRERDGAAPMGSDGRAAYPADRRHPSPERERQLRALHSLHEVGRQPLPAEFFARLHITGDCCDRRMCVALCPTAALTVAEVGQAVELRFDGARCIACGVCQRACPEDALQMQPHGGEPGCVTLVAHRRASCTSCGDAYTDSGDVSEGPDAGLCPTCAKSRRFMDDAQRQLFGGLN